MKTNNTNSKRSWFAFTSIVVVILLGATLIFISKDDQIKQLSSEKVSINDQLIQRDSIVDVLITAFDEVEMNLKAISDKRKQLELADAEHSPNQKSRIIEGMKNLDLMLEANNQKIRKLEKSLNKSGIELKSFKHKIARLNEDINLQNEQIATLKTELNSRDFTISELNKQMVMLNDEIEIANHAIEERDLEIAEQGDEMNKAYIAMGSYKELKERDLVKREGGFLNIGGSKTINSELDDEYFIKVDIRETKEIPLQSNKVKMISEHPDSSYQFVEADGQIASLVINDPDEFWKISKYALIEVQ